MCCDDEVRPLRAPECAHSAALLRDADAHGTFRHDDRNWREIAADSEIGMVTAHGTCQRL